MPARRELRPGFWLVFWREIDWLRRRPFLLAFITLVPIALMAVLIGVFSAGLATRLPIAVLDLDGSDLSRSIIRMVDATPDTAVTVRVGELAEGRRMILSGRVNGLLMLPQHLERDVFAGRRPEVVFFYNTQTMTIGNLTLRGVAAAVPTAAAGIRLSLRTAQGQPVEEAQAALAPIPVQTHALFNPTLNYVFFLLAAILPSLLQLVVVTASAYSVGIDVDTRHRLRILRRLGGGLWPAMAGKLLPYTVLFLLVLCLSDFVLFGMLELPLRGRGWLLGIAAVLFILACQLLGALLALLLRPVSMAISVATLLTSPAFGFMGIGFPRLAMNAFAYGFGALLPGTWYLTARIDQTIRGTPLDLSWKPILVLLAFVVCLAGLTALRLEFIRARNVGRDVNAAHGPRGGAAMTAVLQVFRSEFRRIFTIRPVFSVLVIGAVFYAAFYPQPYLNEALRNVPIAVVDNDGTTASRELARLIDATSDIAVARVLPDLASAEYEVHARNVFGIVVIPNNFERDLMHGRASPIALYADASYFLMYQRVSGGVAAVARTLGAEVESARLIGIGVDPAIAAAAIDPLQLTAVPLFNPQGGYATYVLPGAFVLLLQQLLLMAVGLLGSLPEAGNGARPAAAPLATVLGKMLAYLSVEAVILPLYLIVLPYLYGLPRLGGVVPVLIFAVPFVLSVSGLGLVVAAIFKSPLRVQLVMATVGLPFFFLAGFAWPAQAIPGALHLASLLVPSTSAIDGITRLSQLGASLAEVRGEFLVLWGLAIFYGGIVWMLESGKRRQEGRNRQLAPA